MKNNIPLCNPNRDITQEIFWCNQYLAKSYLNAGWIRAELYYRQHESAAARLRCEIEKIVINQMIGIDLVNN